MAGPFSVNMSNMPTFDPSMFASNATSAPPQQNQGWLGPGLAAGWNEGLGSVDAAAAALGRVTGMQGLQQWGEQGAQQRFAQAKQAANPDYEWGGKNFWSPAGIGYNVAKMAPSLGAMLLAGAAVPEAAVPAGLARLGAVAPRILGGGAGLAEDAAAVAGKAWAKGLVGATAAGYPMTAGNMYQTAVDSGQDTVGHAAGALALGLPAAAVGGIMPAQLRDIAAKGIGGNMIVRALSGAAEVAPANMMQAGVQTALNQPFENPNMTLADRAKQIVDNTLQAGVMGGVIGGLSGIASRAAPRPPSPEPTPAEAPVPAAPAAPEQPLQFGGLLPDLRTDRTVGPTSPLPQRDTTMVGQPYMQAIRPYYDMSTGDIMKQYDFLMNKPGGVTTRQDQVQLEMLRNEITSRVTTDQYVGTDPIVDQLRQALATHGQTGLEGGTPDIFPMINRQDLYTDRRLAEAGQPMLEPGARPVDEIPHAPTTEPPPAPATPPSEVPPAPVAPAAAEAPATKTIADLNIPKGDRQWLFKATKPIEGLDQVDAAKVALIDQLRQGDAPKKAVALADQLGGTNPDGTKWSLADLVDKPYEKLSPDQRAILDHLHPFTEDGKAELAQQGAANALQEQSPAGVDVREQAGNGQGMGVGDTEGGQAPGPGEGQVTAQAQAAQTQPPGNLTQPELDPQGQPKQQVSWRKFDRGWQMTYDGNILGDDRAYATEAQVKAAAQKLVTKDATFRQLVPPGGPATEPAANPTVSGGDLANRTSSDVQRKFGFGPATATQAVETPPMPFADGRNTYASYPAYQPLADLASHVLGALGIRNKVALLTPADAGALYPHMTDAGDKKLMQDMAKPGYDGGMERLSNGGWAMMINPTLNGPQAIETLSHEIGHAVELSALKDAPKSTNVALTNAWNLWRAARTGGSFKQLVESMSPKNMADLALSRLDERTLNARLGTPDSVADVGYWTSFPEWFADNIAKSLTHGGGGQSFVDRYFAGVADKMRGVFRSVYDQPNAPDPVVKAWFDSLVNHSEGFATSQTGRTFGKRLTVPYVPREDLTYTDGTKPGPEAMPQRGSIPDVLRKAQAVPAMSEQARAELENRFARDPWTFVRQFGIGYGDAQNLVRKFDPMFDGAVGLYRDIKLAARAIVDRIAQMNRPVDAELQAAAARDPKGNKTYNTLRSWQVKTGADFRKWSTEQAKLLEATPAENRVAFAAEIDGMKRQWDAISKNFSRADDLSRGVMRSANSIKLILGLQHFARTMLPGAELPVINKDHISDLVQHVKMIEDPIAVAEHLDGVAREMLKELDTLGRQRTEDVTAMRDRAAELDAKITAAKAAKPTEAGAIAALKDLKLESTKTHAEIKALASGNTSINTFLRNMTRALDEQKETPHYALGRDGEHFVSFRLKQLPDGTIDPAALDMLHREAEAKGLDGFQFDYGGEDNLVYTRLQNSTQADQMHMVAATLKANKLLAEDGLDPKTGAVVDPAFRQGNTSNIKAEQYKGILPTAVENMISNLRAAHSDLPPEIVKGMVDDMTNVMLDMLPRNSVRRLWAHRENIMGYQADMSAAQSRYMSQFTNAISRLWAQPRTMDVLSSMVNKVDTMQRDINIPRQQVEVADKVTRELLSREKAVPNRASSAFVRNWLALNHLYYLGLSASYMTELMVQVPTLMLPELGKKYGYVTAAKMIAKAMPDAMRTVKALLKSGHGSDGILTPDFLEKSGISPANADFIMRVANRGGLELGGWTGAIVGDAPSIAKSRLAQRMQMVTVASEAFPRALAAYAAKAAHETDGGVKARAALHNYVDEVIEGSMFTWQQDLQARHLGPRGFAGPLTPLITKFQNFQTKMINRLYAELDDAFGTHAQMQAAYDVKNGSEHSVEDLTKMYRSEAKKFLAGHLAAVTALSGALGLPVFPVVASAASSAANFLTGTDQYDAETWFRQHLVQMFGPQYAEAIAKGLPRLAGGDLSEHAGEQGLIPFSDILTDKRKWDDVFNSAAMHALGSPFNMAANMVKGATDIGNGRVLEGMSKVLPTSVRNFIRAYKMNEYGYEDQKGNKLPIDSPGTYQVMMQAMGIPPAELSRYTEGTEALRSLQDRREVALTNLETNLGLALGHQDQAGIQTAVQKIFDYDKTHPSAMSNPMDFIRGVFQKRMMGAAFGANNFNPHNFDQWRIMGAYGMLPAQH